MNSVSISSGTLEMQKIVILRTSETEIVSIRLAKRRSHQ